MYRRSDGRYMETLTINGIRKFVYGKTQAEVFKKIAELQNHQDDGPTFREAAASWAAAHYSTVAVKTVESYKKPLERLEAAFGDIYLKDITPAQVKAFVDRLANQGLGRTAVRRPLTVLNMIYNHAITQPGSVIRVNPTVAVKIKAGLSDGVRDLPDPKDVKKIKLAVDGEPFGLFAYFIIFSGLRKGELLAITDADVDRKRRVIRVTKEVSWVNNRPVIKPPKTTYSVRDVPLFDALADHLPQWSGYLFSADGGVSPLTETQFRSRWEAYCKAAGLADSTEVVRRWSQKSKLPGSEGRMIQHKRVVLEWSFRLVPHQLRHEFCTLLFDADIPVKIAQRYMGHSKVETTQRIYTHIRESRMVDSADVINRYVAEFYGS